jgi:hypothetical protein
MDGEPSCRQDQHPCQTVQELGIEFPPRLERFSRLLSTDSKANHASLPGTVQKNNIGGCWTFGHIPGAGNSSGFRFDGEMPILEPPNRGIVLETIGPGGLIEALRKSIDSRSMRECNSRDFRGFSWRGWLSIPVPMKA